MFALVAAVSGAAGFWLGRRCSARAGGDRDGENQAPGASAGAPRRSPPKRLDEESLWTLRSKADTDGEEVVRMRFVHINDVYVMDNLPRLRKFLDDCGSGLRRENLIVTVGGDILSPYPLSTLDKGRGMVDVMLESGVQYACFGNHEADVGLGALKQRLERWHERGGVWINTNMPDLLPELNLPSSASVVGLSKDGHNARQICLLGLCTKDPGLYNAPDDFGGAVYTAVECNECGLDTAKELMEAHLNDEEALKVDGIVALTHQDLDVDIELANCGHKAGILAVLGGHDHTEYMNLHGPDHSCLLLKAGMDAQKAGVMDLIWHSPEDKQPQIDFYDLIPLYQFAKSKAVSRSVDKHMRKLWKMEQGKALVHLTVFKEESIMSSKNIRRQQTTLGSFLCSALRDELEADCVVFDGGNIRGDRDYVPQAEHHLGKRWVFTLSDLEQELPWSSDMVVIVLSGGQLAEAIKVSRTEKRGTGGFFQMDTGVRWEAEEVTHIANEPLDKARMYCVGLMHASLAGMNDNHVFKEWRQDHIMPKEDAGKPAKELLKKQFARRMWENEMPEFHEINVSRSGVLSREEIKQAYRKHFPDCPEGALEPSVDNLLTVAEPEDNGDVSPSSYEAIFRLPTWVALSYFSKEQAMSSKNSTREQTTMGSFLCDALKRELDVQCVLFDGGNIRGYRDYIPKPNHHRGNKWAFTVADLRRELPWPSEIAVISMTGREVSEAVQVSRKLGEQPLKQGRRGSKMVHDHAGLLKRIDYASQLVGGFLQTDSGIEINADSVSKIANKPIEANGRYKVALLHAALMGMNQNPVFQKWRETKGNVVPPLGTCRSSQELLKRHFLRKLWKLMPPFHEMDKDQTKLLSRNELLAGISKCEAFRRGGGNHRRGLLRRLLMTVQLDSQGKITLEEYQKTLSIASQVAGEDRDMTQDSEWSG